MSKEVIPRNTQKCNQWVLTMFMEWMEARNKHTPGEQCSKDVQETEDAECL